MHGLEFHGAFSVCLGLLLLFYFSFLNFRDGPVVFLFHITFYIFNVSKLWKGQGSKITPLGCDTLSCIWVQHQTVLYCLWLLWCLSSNIYTLSINLSLPCMESLWSGIPDVCGKVCWHGELLFISLVFILLFLQAVEIQGKLVCVILETTDSTEMLSPVCFCMPCGKQGPCPTNLLSDEHHVYEEDEGLWDM